MRSIFSNGLYLLYFACKKPYTVFSKVDSARQVSRLGKSVNERAHLSCGASVWSVAITFDYAPFAAPNFMRKRLVYISYLHGLLLHFSAKGVFL